MISAEKIGDIVSLAQILIPSVVAILSIGIVYGTLIAQIKNLKEESKRNQVNSDKLIALETKMDFIISQLKNKN